MFANKGIKDMHCYVDSNLKAKERGGGKGGGGGEGRGGGGRGGKEGEGRGEGEEGRRRGEGGGEYVYGKRRVIAMTRRAGIFTTMNFRIVGEKREVIPLCVCIAHYYIYTISVLYNSEV